MWAHMLTKGDQKEKRQKEEKKRQKEEKKKEKRK